MHANFLYNMNTRQVEALARKTSIAFLPIGPTEVHAPHLPLGTDVESALEVCERASAKLQEHHLNCLIASPINYALADVANCFSGNTTLRFGTVVAIVEDVCTSLARWGFTYVVVMCGHAEPGNIKALQEGGKRAMERTDGLKVRVSSWLLGSNIRAAMTCAHPEWDIHAGESETALMLMRRPELVDTDILPSLEPNWAGEFFPERLAEGRDFIGCGAVQAYLGDPRAGTAETGRKVYDIYADFVVNEILGDMAQDDRAKKQAPTTGPEPA